MADIKAVGTDLVSGQNKPIAGGDTIRPSTGNLTVSAGNPSTDTSNGALITIIGGDGGDSSGNGGNVQIRDRKSVV